MTRVVKIADWHDRMRAQFTRCGCVGIPVECVSTAEEMWSA